MSAASPKNRGSIPVGGVCGRVIVRMILDSEIHKGNAGVMERTVVRGVRPVLKPGGVQELIVAEEDAYRRARLDVLQQRLQPRRMRRARGVNLIASAAPDHIQVDVQSDRSGRHQ